MTEVHALECDACRRKLIAHIQINGGMIRYFVGPPLSKRAAGYEDFGFKKDVLHFCDFTCFANFCDRLIPPEIKSQIKFFSKEEHDKHVDPYTGRWRKGDR